jgi:hypothetical protein
MKYILPDYFLGILKFSEQIMRNFWMVLIIPFIQ